MVCLSGSCNYYKMNSDKILKLENKTESLQALIRMKDNGGNIGSGGAKAKKKFNFMASPKKK